VATKHSMHVLPQDIKITSEEYYQCCSLFERWFMHAKEYVAGEISLESRNITSTQ
jgi:hypothetical protein